MSDGKAGVEDQKALPEDQVAGPQTRSELEQKAAVKEFNKAGDPSMKIKVYSPYADYFDGPAFSISAENETGPFDILPHHHSFISLLSPCDMIIRSVKEGDRRIRISGGIMHVKADEVVVFLDV